MTTGHKEDYSKGSFYTPSIPVLVGGANVASARPSWVAVKYSFAAPQVLGFSNFRQLMLHPSGSRPLKHM